MSTVLVLGAGMVGVSTALHLQKRGHDVVIVDRGTPGRETSFGNAGLIQREAVEPYAMPRDVLALWHIAAGVTNDVAFSYRRLPAHLLALLRYWNNSGSGRYGTITTAYASLIAQCIPAHEEFIEASSSWDLVRRDGYRSVYRTRAELDAAAVKAERLVKFGVSSTVEDARAIEAAEPALISAGAGGIHWHDPWAVSNPGGLVEAYYRLYLARGGTYAQGDATTLARVGSGWSVKTSEGEVQAEQVVVCLGPWSDEFLRPFGLSFSMVRKRGYHRHYATAPTLKAPVFDMTNGYVMAPMVAGLRITTGAHLATFSAPDDLRQLRRAEAAARELIRLGEPVEQVPWHGTRPCMPDMLPVIGRSARLPGMWMNFGHGHQGFTLGPASGALLAALMSGDAPPVEPGPFRPDR